MSNCKFKVGDTGKTRDGRDYQILLVDAALADNESIIAKVGGYALTYFDNGNYYSSGREAAADLMPPTKSLYLNIYPKGGLGYGNDVAVHPDEDTARRKAGPTALLVAHKVEIPRQ